MFVLKLPIDPPFSIFDLGLHFSGIRFLWKKLDFPHESDPTELEIKILLKTYFWIRISEKLRPRSKIEIEGSIGNFKTKILTKKNIDNGWKLPCVE